MIIKNIPKKQYIKNNNIKLFSDNSNKHLVSSDKIYMNEKAKTEYNLQNIRNNLKNKNKISGLNTVNE